MLLVQNVHFFFLGMSAKSVFQVYELVSSVGDCTKCSFFFLRNQCKECFPSVSVSELDSCCIFIHRWKIHMVRYIFDKVVHWSKMRRSIGCSNKVSYWIIFWILIDFDTWDFFRKILVWTFLSSSRRIQFTISHIQKSCS